MAENEQPKKKMRQPKDPLIGRQAEPTVLNKQAKIDIDTSKSLLDDIIVASQTNRLDATQIEHFTTLSNSRDQMYQQIDTMAQDSTISSILRTEASDVCTPSDNGHIIWAESGDANISKHVNYLLDIMNIDKNIYKWTYSLLEYGDLYLRLGRESDFDDRLFDKATIDSVFGTHSQLNEDLDQQKMDESVKLNVHRARDQYSHYVEMVADPSTMFELTKYGKTCGYVETPNQDLNIGTQDSYLSSVNASAASFNYRLKTNDVIIYQADDFVHACLDDNFTRFPETVQLFSTDSEETTTGTSNSATYSVRRGKSILYDSYKVWREKSLLENAVLLNRLTRSSVIRNWQIEVGDMSKEKSAQVARQMKDLIEQKSYVTANGSFGEYCDPGAIINDIFTVTHGGQGALTCNSTSNGDANVKDLADLDNWVNKLYAAYGIPKQYFGYTDDAAGFNGGSSLAMISSEYAKQIVHVQNALIQAITDIINLEFINRGYLSYVNNFTIKMKTPMSAEEKDYRESLANKITAISNLQGLFTDVENKVRRLNILKYLLQSLNYGDELQAIIDGEIKDLEKAAEEEKAKEAEEAAAEENAPADNGGAAPEPPAGGEAPGGEPPAEGGEAPADEGGEDLNLDLSSLPAAESFMTNGGSTTLTEDTEFMTEADDLPSPDELGDIDFSENK